VKRFQLLFVFTYLAISSCEDYRLERPFATVQGFNQIKSIAFDEERSLSIDSLLFASGKKSYILKGVLVINDTLQDFTVVSQKPFTNKTVVETSILPITFEENLGKVDCTVLRNSENGCEIEWASGAQRLFLRNRILPK
jgi:hypothetical protein